MFVFATSLGFAFALALATDARAALSLADVVVFCVPGGSATGALVGIILLPPPKPPSPPILKSTGLPT